MKIYKDNQDSRNGMEHLYRVSFSTEGTAKQIEKWSVEPEAEHNFNNFCEFMTAEQDGKYFVFASTTNGDWAGIESNEKVMEKIKEVSAEQAAQYISRIIE